MDAAEGSSTQPQAQAESNPNPNPGHNSHSSRREVPNERYSRQMFLAQLGVAGQQRLSHSRVAVVGAGGLGSTVLLYLAGAGIGTLHIIDRDTVEVSNLHRQVLHTTAEVGRFKVDSARRRLLALNPTIQVIVSNVAIDSTNALELLDTADAIVDCTDNFQTRYTLNDAAVLLRRPLISGAAIGLEGQLTVIYPFQGPCYRCIHPLPSRSENCRSCATAGVLGPVPGLIGTLQAIECIKVLLDLDRFQEGGGSSSSSSSSDSAASDGVSATEPRAFKPIVGRQIFYDGLFGEFETFALPPRNLACPACGGEPIIRSMADSQAVIAAALTECQPSSLHSTLPDLDPSLRWTPLDYVKRVLGASQPHLVLDVRSDVLFELVNLHSQYFRDKELAPLQRHFEPSASSDQDLSLPVVLNIPLKLLTAGPLQLDLLISRREEIARECGLTNPQQVAIFTLCRRGNDSVRAAHHLIQAGLSNVHNIDGGMTGWRTHIDPDIPEF